VLDALALAVSGTPICEAQIVVEPCAVIVTVGLGFMVTEMAFLVPVQPFTSVTVTTNNPELMAVIVVVVWLVFQL
jgi:hypothetical protein